MLGRRKVSWSTVRSCVGLCSRSPKARSIVINPTSIIEQDIIDAVPKVDEMVKSLSPEIRSCLPLLSIGAMSHGSIGYLPHVHISAGANLTALFAYRYQLQEDQREEFDKYLQENGVQKALHYLWSKKDIEYPGPTSNSGEGGELPVRDGSIYQSYTRQVASGRFGVDLRYMGNACELQIKVSQGAKPGVGGQLLGMKVTDEIAAARFSTPGMSLLSPPPHHDIYSIEDLRQLIHDLRTVNPDAKISVKIASNYGCGPVAVGIAKCFAPSKEGEKIGIIIAGPGGTGAASITDKHEINHPWELSLSETHQMLVNEGLRDRTILTASGGIQTGTDVFKALLLGADRTEIGSSVLVSLGCVMVSQCHTGKCPAGIATTDWKHIQERYKGKPEHVARMLVDIATAVSRRLNSFGFAAASDAIGRVDLLKVKDNAPLQGLTRLINKSHAPNWAQENQKMSDHSKNQVEQDVIERIERGEKVVNVKASSAILSFGARIGYESLQNQQLLEQPTLVNFDGLAVGQSFGFAAPEGLNLTAENANDGVGKLLSGGNIFVKKLAGSCVGYGASKGLIAVANCGDRLAVRANHEVRIIVGKTGNSACNFMTGGRVTILQDAGPNLGAGLTGGAIYMPRALYSSLQERSYLAESVISFGAQQLDEDDIKILEQDLAQYNTQVENINDINLFDFIKISPPNNIAHAPPVADSDAIELVPFWNEKTSFTPSQLTGQISQPQREKDNCGVGVIVNRNGKPTRELVERAFQMVASFSHRGSIPADERTGDGCGITFYGLHSFFVQSFPQLNLIEGEYGVIVLKTDDNGTSVQLMKKLLEQENLEIIGKRRIETDPSVLGPVGLQYEGPVKQYIVKSKQFSSRHELEKSLVRMRLRFEFKMQSNTSKTRPHIFSASTYHYFKATDIESFQAVAAVSHVRFATNTLPQMKNIQPLPGLVNNGENNNIGQIERLLTEDPGLKQLLDTDCDLTSLSDSHVQSIFVDYAFLERFKDQPPSIDAVMNVAKAVNPTYVPKNKPQRDVSEYYDVMGDPWEGPFGGVLCFGDVLTIMRDRNGFRPLRGVMNDTYLYVGSELGPVEIEGETFNISPANPMVINTSTGQHLHSVKNSTTSIPLQTIGNQNTQSIQNTGNESNHHPSWSYPSWSNEEFEIVKRRAGWTNEVDQMVIQRLLRGEELTSSMADQGPVEALVPGSNIDLGAFFKAKFAQVTNPALAKREEACFMSSDTWIGRKTEFGHWDDFKSVQGVMLNSPIIDANELALLQESNQIQSKQISILYKVNEYDQGLESAIQRILQECIDAVKNNVNMIVLSDLIMPDGSAIELDSQWMSIYPVFIAAEVDRALRNHGLRRKTAVIMQAAPVLLGRDVAQLISIGGIDAIHPYLVLMSVVNDQQATNHYKERLRQEILSFMARMGISRISAYRGAKIFSAFGLDQELATRFGVESRLGGLGMADMAKLKYNNYHVPSIEGLGRYQNKESDNEVVRDKIWKPEVTQRLIKASRRQNQTIDEFAEFEMYADSIKTGCVPRGWLDIIKPTRWTVDQPLPIAIIGGGAAGFYLAQHLLESKIPVHITLIERNYVNRCGLVGYGVAPDHTLTKKQGYALLKSVVENDNVEYYGGIQVGKTVDFDELRNSYPCIVDCRGATKDIELNIPGQEHPSVLAASRVYEAYNSALIFDYHSLDWPFNDKSRHPAIAIVGMGNVAADISRILLSPPEKLIDTCINPEFLVHLRRKAPSIVYVIARGDPTQCKITKKELEELVDLKKHGVSIHVSFTNVENKQLNEHEQYLLDLFTSLRDEGSKHGRKQLHFMFQSTPEYIQDVNGDVEIYFEGKKDGIRARNIITALGRAPQKSNENVIDQVDYVAGWAARKGGNLRVAEQSAMQVAEKIVKDFHKHKFHTPTKDHKIAGWKFLSPVNKFEFMSIFEYSDKHVIRNANDFHVAKIASLSQNKQNEDDNVAIMSFPENVDPNPEYITVFDGEKRWDVSPGQGTTLLQDLKRVARENTEFQNVIPTYECDGEGTCGSCGLLSDSKLNGELQSSKERRLLSIAGDVMMRKCGVLTCQHSSEKLKGKVLFAPQALERPESGKQM